MESEQRRPSAQIVERPMEVFNFPPEERTSFLRFARGDWQALFGKTLEATSLPVSHLDPRWNSAQAVRDLSRSLEEAMALVLSKN